MTGQKTGYNVSFYDAIEKCLNGEGFIRGEDFERGMYVKEKGGMLLMVSAQMGWHEEQEPLLITRGIRDQKYKVFTVANKVELEMFRG